MKNQWLAIKQLDKQLKEWQMVSQKYGKPKPGWIKTLRMALSMTAEQLAERMHLSRARVVQLENAEAHDAVTLRTLREAADALGCELVYAIVPKSCDTLENIIKARVTHVAESRVLNVAHSMSLESQSVDTDMLQFQKDMLVKTLMEHPSKKYWDSPVKKKLSGLREKLLENKKREKKK